jgi:hypothetical protein
MPPTHAHKITTRDRQRTRSRRSIVLPLIVALPRSELLPAAGTMPTAPSGGGGGGGCCCMRRSVPPPPAARVASAARESGNDTSELTVDRLRS